MQKPQIEVVCLAWDGVREHVYLGQSAEFFDTWLELETLEGLANIPFANILRIRATAGGGEGAK